MMSKLSWPVKVGLVIGGYAAACLVAGGVVSVYQSLTQNMAYQASAGMAAFGDFILFLVVLGFLLLFPTGLALFFLVQRLRLR
jgi:hypothetical protein